MNDAWCYNAQCSYPHGKIPTLECFKNLIKNSEAVKKRVQPPKAMVKKKSEIQVGGQEMAVVVGKWQKI